MTEALTQWQIEQLNDQELRAHFSQIFNALACRQQLLHECEQLQMSLQNIQMEIYRRAK